ncbi:MAG: hypothetical protein V2I43_22730 [Parvularcula sp.]|nr:hypothetical protein [Parvularcula sp.]
MMLGRLLTHLLVLVTALALPFAVSAQEKTGSKDGFTLQQGTVRIALLEPRIIVGEQSTGGMFEPNADWTEQARENLERELSAALGGVGNEVVRLNLNVTPEADSLRRYNYLFGAVAGSVVEYQFFPGNRLPTKKKEKSFEWTVGPGLRGVMALEGFDYVLMIRTKDAYGSTGRKALQIVGLLAGVGVTSGEHVGMAGLVDIKTGDLVWLNADLQMGGDPRTPEGAAKRVGQLLEGFPGMEPPKP